MKKTAVAVIVPKKDGYPEFDIPDGYKAPVDVDPGDTFEEVATFKIKPNGKVCLVEIAGVEIESPEEDKDEEMEESEDMGVGERFSKYRSGNKDRMEMEDMMAGE